MATNCCPRREAGNTTFTWLLLTIRTTAPCWSKGKVKRRQEGQVTLPSQGLLQRKAFDERAMATTRRTLTIQRIDQSASGSSECERSLLAVRRTKDVLAHSARKETKNKLREEELRAASATRTVSTSERDLANDKEQATSCGVRTSLSGSPTLASVHQLTTKCPTAIHHVLPHWLHEQDFVQVGRSVSFA